MSESESVPPSHNRPSAGPIEYTVTILAIVLGLLSCAVHAGIIPMDWLRPPPADWGAEVDAAPSTDHAHTEIFYQ